MADSTPRCRWCGATDDLIECICGFRCRHFVPCHARDMQRQYERVKALREKGWLAA